MKTPRTLPLSHDEEEKGRKKKKKNPTGFPPTTTTRTRQQPMRCVLNFRSREHTPYSVILFYSLYNYLIINNDISIIYGSE